MEKERASCNLVIYGFVDFEKKLNRSLTYGTQFCGFQLNFHTFVFLWSSSDRQQVHTKNCFWHDIFPNATFNLFFPSFFPSLLLSANLQPLFLFCFFSVYSSLFSGMTFNLSWKSQPIGRSEISWSKLVFRPNRHWTNYGRFSRCSNPSSPWKSTNIQ